MQLDQTQDDSVKQLIVRITQEYGHLDAFHMNAGAGLAPVGNICFVAQHAHQARTPAMLKLTCHHLIPAKS